MKNENADREKNFFLKPLETLVRHEISWLISLNYKTSEKIRSRFLIQEALLLMLSTIIHEPNEQLLDSLFDIFRFKRTECSLKI